jgi:cytosine/adenosine deaminase-related metal-dependent hydrolase
VIHDGGLAVADKRILAVGPWSQLRRDFSDAKIHEHPDCCLLPGLVNAHLHLELSSLSRLSDKPAPPHFTSWIEELIIARSQQERENNVESVYLSAKKVLLEQWQNGVHLLADIGNTSLGADLQDEFNGILLPFHEYLGLRNDVSSVHCESLTRIPETTLCTGHAPYSTHADLLYTLKQRSRKLGHPFSLHVAETAAEVEFIQSGRGELRDFIEKRGGWDGSFMPLGGKDHGVVEYLERLGLLDAKTLCVHGVHVSKEEVVLLARQKAKVCLCPGSNRFLQVGKAPLEMYLQKGILPGLGTDSLASNPRLSIWREMRLVAEDHPAVSPEVILGMATLGGAATLGLDGAFGSLEQGKDASVLACGVGQVSKEDELLNFLVWEEPVMQLKWLDEKIN